MNLEEIKARCVEEGECLLWQGSLAGGYIPTVRRGNAYLSVRNVAYDLSGRKRNPKQIVGTTCGHRECLNPDHLALRKSRSKTGRKWSEDAKRRQAILMREIKGKLNPTSVQSIRDSDEPLRAIAQKHGVALKTVQNARSHGTWKDYSNPFAGLMA